MDYFKRFLKFEMYCLLTWVVIHVLTILFMWFVDLQFPWNFVDFDREFRGWFASYIVFTCLGCLMAALPSPNTKVFVNYSPTVNDTKPVQKQTSALDIAVGVGTGIIGAEIITDLLDIGE